MLLFLAAVVCGVTVNTRVRLRSHLPICSLTTKTDDTSISAVAKGDCQPVLILFILSEQYLYNKHYRPSSWLILVAAEHMQFLFLPPARAVRLGGKCILLGRTATVPAAAIHQGKANPGLKVQSSPQDLRLPGSRQHPGWDVPALPSSWALWQNVA